MSTSRFARRQRQLGALVAGFCVVAGSVGSAALADSGSSSGGSVSVDASVLVQVGMSPVNAQQAAANLNAAIDSAAQTMARSAASAIPAGKPVQTTASATKAFATEVDAALTEFVVSSIRALKPTGASTDALVRGTLAALAQVVRTIPGAVTVTTGAEIAVAGGSDGASVSASLNPKVQTAIRQTISDSVHALQPLLPLTRATLRAVATGVRGVVDAEAKAVDRIVKATVNLATAVVNVTTTTLNAARSVAESAVTAIGTIVSAVDSTLDTLSDVNISAQVDASLGVSAH
jgi:hypothetical protein